MQIYARIAQILTTETGTTKAGKAFSKKLVILETEGQYPKKVAITIWNDNISKFTGKQGDLITAHIEAESREYQGKWYTELKAWKIENGSANGGTRDGTSVQNVAKTFDAVPEDDDLPF